MVRWTLEDLEQVIARQKANRGPRAYVAALEAHRERLLAKQRNGDGQTEAAPKVRPEKAAELPDLEVLADKPVDVEEMVADLLAWWRGHGLAALKKKAARGDIRALQLMSTISRQLAEMEKASREACPRECCRAAANRRQRGRIKVDWPPEGFKS